MQEVQLADGNVPIGKLLNEEIKALADKYGVAAVKFASWCLMTPVREPDAAVVPDEGPVDRARRTMRERRERVEYVTRLLETAARYSSVGLTRDDLIATVISFDASINQDEALMIYYDEVDRRITREDEHSNIGLV